MQKTLQARDVHTAWIDITDYDYNIFLFFRKYY